MENVHLKDVDSPMEKKDWESSDKCNFCDESSNTSQQPVDNIVPVSFENCYNGLRIISGMKSRLCGKFNDLICQK